MARQYSKKYQKTHDIDWFFQCRSCYFHVASNGLMIPSEIMSQSNYDIQTKVYEMEEVCDVVVNEEWITNYVLHQPLPQEYESINDNPLENYLKSFRSMARKGFVSLDTRKTKENQEYILVAYPKQLKNINLNTIAQMGIPKIDGLIKNIIDPSDFLKNNIDDM